MESADVAPWLQSLVNDGIVAGVGAVIGFIPQMIILFLLLGILELCGYMSRVAFIMDRVFRKFGLSGKSFIPMLIASGCGVPAVMATKTIENEMDRRMTIMTTTMIPCGAKMPIIALVFGALASGDSDAYLVGCPDVLLHGRCRDYHLRHHAEEDQAFRRRAPRRSSWSCLNITCLP